MAFQRDTLPLGALDVRISDRDAPPGTLRMVRNLCVVGPPQRPYYSPVETARQVHEQQDIRGLGTQVRMRRGDLAEVESSLRRLVSVRRDGIYLIDPEDDYSAVLAEELPGDDPNLSAQMTQLTSSVWLALSGLEPGIGIPTAVKELRDDVVLPINPPSVPTLDVAPVVDETDGLLEEGRYLLRCAWLFDDGTVGPPGQPYTVELERSPSGSEMWTLDVTIDEIPDPLSQGWRDRITGLILYMGFEVEGDPNGETQEEKDGIELFQAPLYRVGLIEDPQLADKENLNFTRERILTGEVLEDQSLLQHELRAGAVHSYNKRLLLGDVAYDYYRPSLTDVMDWEDGVSNAGGNSVWVRLLVEIESPEGTIRRWSDPKPYDGTTAADAPTNGFMAYRDVRALRWGLYTADSQNATSWNQIVLNKVEQTFREGFGNLGYNEVRSTFNLQNTTDATQGLGFTGTTSVSASAYVPDLDENPQAPTVGSDSDTGTAEKLVSSITLDPGETITALTADFKVEVDASRPSSPYGGSSAPGGEAWAKLKALDSSGTVLGEVTRTVDWNLPAGSNPAANGRGGRFEVYLPVSSLQGTVDKFEIEVYASAYAGQGESEADARASVLNIKLITPLGEGYGPEPIDVIADHEVIDHDRNRVLASTTLQPRDLKAERVYYVGDGPADGVVGFAANAMPVSEGQFGDYPLFVLCSESISAARPGRGDVAFVSFPTISKRGVVGRNAFTNVDNMIAFISRDGLWGLGRELSPEPLSAPLHADGATGTLFGCLGPGAALGYYNDRARGRRELWLSAGVLTFCYSMPHQRWTILDRARTHYTRLGDDTYGVTKGGTQEYDPETQEQLEPGVLMIEAGSVDPIEIAVSTTRMDLGHVGHWKRLRKMWVRMGKRLDRLEYEIFDHDPKTLGEQTTEEVSILTGEFSGPELDAVRIGKGLAIQPRIELRGEGRPGETLEAIGLEWMPRMTHRPPASMPEVGTVQPGWTCGSGFDGDLGLQPEPLGELEFLITFAYENGFGLGRGIGRIGWALSVPAIVESFVSLDRSLVEAQASVVNTYTTPEEVKVGEYEQYNLAVNADYWVQLRATAADGQVAISRLMLFETSEVVDLPAFLMPNPVPEVETFGLARDLTRLIDSAAFSAVVTTPDNGPDLYLSVAEDPTIIMPTVGVDEQIEIAQFQTEVDVD